MNVHQGLSMSYIAPRGLVTCSWGCLTTVIAGVPTTLAHLTLKRLQRPGSIVQTIEPHFRIQENASPSGNINKIPTVQLSHG
jgi:hypothetical protein